MITHRIIFFVVMRVVLFLLIIGCDSVEPAIEDPPEPKEPEPEWDVSVKIDFSAPDMTSDFEIGFTHTHSGWEFGNSEAVERVKDLLEDANIRYQNTHIMGWGPGNPNPEPGVYNWSSLDNRMDLIRSMEGVVPVITLCTAPGWMKTSGEDWNMDDRVADEHVDDFAELSREVAMRYEDVQYFQVWNEFKGYRSWSDDRESVDIERFTTLYNAVYEAIKEVRPDAQIGGPYIPLGGTELTASHIQNVEYWSENSSGAEFFTYDGWLEGWPPGGNTEEWMMSRTSFYGELTEQFRDVVDLPVWVSEYYPGRNDDEEFVAAHYASTYYHSLKNDTRMALLWGEYDLARLFTSTDSSDGGRPLLQYYVVEAFNNHFGPGTLLYEAESDSDEVEVLASEEKIMLINKQPEELLVDLNGEDITLESYEVRVMDTP